MWCKSVIDESIQTLLYFIDENQKEEKTKEKG